MAAGRRVLSGGICDVAELAAGSASKPMQTRKRHGLIGLARRLTLPLRRFISGDAADDNGVEAKAAVAYFLGEMLAAAGRTYPVWSKLLDEALSECSLSFDDRRALYEVHPIDDYYFAGVVALECARMRGHFDALEATEILGEVGDQVDEIAGRQDRVVSDLVFYVLGRIELGSGVDRMKAPHDKVVKALLQHMGVHKVETTAVLLRDKALRHLLAEPLALGVPQWWKSFRTQFKLFWTNPESEPKPVDDDVVSATAPAEEAARPSRRRLRRRAAAF
jgi:hypothetical protein